MPYHYVVGLDADRGDILMVTVPNDYKNFPGAPETEFLLVTQSLDESGSVRMMRVVGATKQAVQSWDKRREITFLVTTRDIMSILQEYFLTRAERLHRFVTDELEAPKALSRLIH